MTAFVRCFGWVVVALLGGLLLLGACSNDDTAANSVALSAGKPADGFAETMAESSEEFESDPSEGTEIGNVVAFSSATIAPTSADSMSDDSMSDDSRLVLSANSAAQETPLPEISPIDVGRQIIYTAEIVIQVIDVPAATLAANQAIAELGGFLFGQDTRMNVRPRTVLTYKVDPSMFDQAMRALEGVGELQRQTTQTDDVTERVVDLQSRITTAELSVERVRTLIGNATEIEGLVELEQQLLERETLLEQLKGRLRTLQNQVSLATITVTINELREEDPDASINMVVWLGENEEDACPGLTDLTIEANDNAVLCVEVRNTGDDVLTGIDINVPTLRMRVDDLTLRSGNLNALEPGGVVVAVAELESVDGFVRRVNVNQVEQIEVNATAVPAASLLPHNDEQELRVSGFVYLEASVTDPLPGFFDSVSSGWSAITRLASALLIIIGTALPFVPFAALATGLFWYLARKRKAKNHDQTAAKNLEPRTAQEKPSTNEEPSIDRPHI